MIADRMAEAGISNMGAYMRKMALNGYTENAKIEPFDKDGVTGYFFQKDGMSYICFERDGCFFSVYGSIDTDELVKIAASITKK